MTLLWLVAAWLGAAGAVLALAFRRPLAQAWREPVLARPVLIVESDDWGYGPAVQAARLDALAGVLAAHRDATGRCATMTVGVVLAGPDTARNRAAGLSPEHRLYLDAAALEPVRLALERGRRRGLFALQLHGMEHYWPASLHAAAERDAALRAWLTGEALPATESLPAPLQSRWTDARALPSRPQPAAARREAVAAEVAEFRRVFGETPRVVVPPTFVWDEELETLWAGAGVEVLVTPGRRYAGRDADGRPLAEPATYRNGEAAAGGLTRVVRDDYFEPSFGHRPERALAALAAKTRLGRPTLLETHRSNFIGDEAVAKASCAALDALLGAALARHPDLRFLATAELAAVCRDSRASLRERRPIPRLRVVLLRLAEISRLRKLAWITGLALPVGLFLAATRPASAALR